VQCGVHAPRRGRTPQQGLGIRRGSDAPAYRAFVLGLPEHAVAGGAAYDALVAATASAGGAELITFDRRAAAVYESYGVQARFLA
jgi:hypothetical protein